MQLINSIYLNQYATSYLIAASFTIIASLLCFFIKERSSATLHLGLTFASGAAVYAALVVLQSLYDPSAMGIRWMTLTAPLAFQIHATQFLLRFPKVSHPRFTRYLMACQWTAVVLITIFAVFSLRKSPPIFPFESHAWDYSNFEVPRLVALFTFANAMLLYAVGVWRCVIVTGRDRTAVISLLVSIFIVTFLPGLGNVMLREGSLDRGLFLSMFAILSVISYFCISVLYINHARDRTSFMTKIIGISLATFLLVLQILSHYFLKDRELSYDEIHRRDANLLPLTQQYTDDFEYHVTYSPPAGVRPERGSPLVDFTNYEEEIANTWALESLVRNADINFARTIEDLPVPGPYFSGYRKSILTLAASPGFDAASPAASLLKHLSGLERPLLNRANKMRQIPDQKFRDAAQKFLAEQEPWFTPFGDAIRAHMAESGKEGKDLKADVLRYLAPMHRAGVRHFRHGRLPAENFVSFTHVEPGTNRLHEIGFSYRAYRAYLHEAALRIALALFAIMITVLLGFRIFFLGTLVNPLHALLSGVTRVNQGDLSFVAKARVEDELGFLTRSFNRMVWSIRNEKNRVRKYTEHLEDMVQTRTADLEEAKEKVVHADKQKTAFFQNISHELRTPLTLILGPLETATRTGKHLDQQTRDMVYFNAKRLLHHVNQLLDLQKVAAGKMSLNRKTVDLREFLSMTSGAFGPYVLSKGLRMHHRIDDNLPLADVDIDAIDKCMYNYLSNALKFTPAGGSITIAAETCDSKIRVSVTDTGAGVPEEKQKFLFQRFGYSEVSLTREQEGTGLGLALVAELIELHGGEVGVTSKSGEGSTFYFTVPTAAAGSQPAVLDDLKLRSGDIAVRAVDPEETTSSIVKSGTTQNGTVLLADDNGDLRSYMKGILLEAGCQVMEAHNGQVALDRLRNFKPDLLITDLMMPVMSGVDLVKNMREMPGMKTVPVILLTAKADEETRREVRDAGADIYLSKPFNNSEFLSAVRNLLSLKSKESALLRDLAIARELQMKLLPAQLPEGRGFRMAARFLPMEQVGGDLYDVVEGPDDKVGIFVGDVSGHGVPAAMIASMTKLALHTASASFPDPGRVLSGMNSLLHKRTGSHHVTAIYLVLDADSRTISFANAGHPALLICRKTSTAYFETENLFLGLEQDLRPGTDSIQLEPGDRVFAYTDACTEARSPAGDFFDDQRFLELVQSTRHLKLEAQLDVVVSAIQTFRASPFLHDDLTIIGIEMIEPA